MRLKSRELNRLLPKRNSIALLHLSDLREIVLRRDGTLMVASGQLAIFLAATPAENKCELRGAADEAFHVLRRALFPTIAKLNALHAGHIGHRPCAFVDITGLVGHPSRTRQRPDLLRLNAWKVSSDQCSEHK